MADVSLIGRFSMEKKAALARLAEVLASVPLRRNRRAERARLGRIQEALARHIASATITRRPGKAERFGAEELGDVLATAGILDDTATRQAWTRVKRFLGGQLELR